MSQAACSRLCPALSVAILPNFSLCLPRVSWLLILLQAAVLSESAATLVLDHNARVVYATDKLATMLGYPVASLLKMELGALLPQPYCQLYKPWLNPAGWQTKS
jgi:PAS domain-containing protein